jgi:hypothetical protein
MTFAVQAAATCASWALVLTLSAILLLPEQDTGSSSVLGNELKAGCFEGSTDSRDGRSVRTEIASLSLKPLDGRQGYPRGLGQIFLIPPH